MILVYLKRGVRSAKRMAAVLKLCNLRHRISYFRNGGCVRSWQAGL